MKYHLYYKADTGYNRSVTFGKDELEKVLYAFLTEKRVLLADGSAIDGKYIQQISPDWHRIMGWSEGYRLGSDDLNELSDRGIDLAARDFQALTSDNVRHLIATGRQPSALPATNQPLLS
jgi:hypothetical protein